MDNQTTIAEIQISYSSSVKKKDRVQISNSQEAYVALLNHWKDSHIELKEDFKILLLNRANDILGIYHASTGGTSGTVVEVKQLLAVAIKANASGIILAHNHPSGNLNPSKMDLQITRKVSQACSVMDITLLDHIILTKEAFYSFADEGDLN
jgi:DNA repair protein RadC